MKRFLSLVSMVFGLFLLVGCDSRPKLYVLNWEQYINPDLIEAFEAEFNVKVVLHDTTSNESMYNKIVTRAEKYDIVIPSDYMIERMHSENLLVELDFEKLPNYDASKFDPTLQELRDDYFAGNQDYAVPYFWGTLGIMYNNKKAGVKNLVEANGWSVFFEQDLIPSGVSVGMYDSSRDAVAAAELYLELDLNTTKAEDLTAVENHLRNNFFSQWGTDDLKRYIAEQNLDIALVYSGDYFDQLFLALEIESEVTFDMFVPQDNNIWFDAMVIPTTSTRTDLAHKFINFFLNFDNALENASYVGYCPTLKDVYEAMTEDEELAEVVLHPGYYPGNLTGRISVYRNLGEEIALRMDQILTRAKIK